MITRCPSPDVDVLVVVARYSSVHDEHLLAKKIIRLAHTLACLTADEASMKPSNGVSTSLESFIPWV